MTAPDLFRRTAQSWADRLLALPADVDWDAPTPCADWSVRDLVNHVAGEGLWAVPLLEGRTIEEVGDRFEGDVLGEDPVAAALEAVAGAVAADTDRATVHLSYGEEDTGEYLHQLAADHLVHGWDLAVATGGDPTLDPDLVAEVGAWFADREELYRSAGVIGPRADGGGDPQADLLAGFGRDPSWGTD
jgi:uncharacterized protein (TIGR03086 family)